MSSAPSLSLFRPPESSSLPELYENIWADQRNPKTRSDDRRVMQLWDELHPGVPADQLTFQHARDFRRKLDEMVKTKQVVPNTANKYGRHINRFLKLLGPNDGSIDPEDPDELQPIGILSAPLRIKVPSGEARDVDDWIELEESGSFLGAAQTADWLNPQTGRPIVDGRDEKTPPKMPAPLWWSAAWLLIYNSALRIEEASKVKHSDLYRDKSGWWLRVQRDVSKTGYERSVYMNKHALAAIEQLKTDGRPTILAWDYSLSFLNRLRREIFERALLHRLIDQQIGWHGLRKACATELYKLGGDDVAAMHLGHRRQSVTGKHYMHKSAVCPHVDRLPQPTPIVLTTQLSLF